MKEVVISIGHGVNTFPETGSKGVIKNGVRYAEHTFNAIVGMKVKKVLEDHGVKVHLVQQPNAKDVPLATRTTKANQIKPDLYWSIHANAGSNQGMAAFYWSTNKNAEKAAELYAKFAKEAGLTLYSDGSYPSVAGTWNDFHELRVNNKNGIVAVLTENGFMTHPDDFQRIFLNKDDFHNVISKVNAKAILAYLGITYKGGTTATPKPTKPVVTKPKPKEEDEMLEKAVVIGGYPDFAGAELVSIRLKAPIYFRNALPSGVVAKELYVVGGTVEGLKAEKIINLSGKSRFEVMENVKKFLG